MMINLESEKIDMDTNVELTIRFEGKNGTYENSGECDLYRYPDSGLYYLKKVGKFVKNLTKVAEIIENIEVTYMKDIPDILLFDEVSNFNDISDYDTIKITEIITGDFAHSKLEMIAEDAGIDPNSPMKSEYVYDISSGKDKPRKIFVISDDGENIDVTNYI